MSEKPSRHPIHPPPEQVSGVIRQLIQITAQRVVATLKESPAPRPVPRKDGSTLNAD